MDYLIILQITISVTFIVLVLLQQRGSAIGSIMGGGNTGESYLSRRGIEKKLFWATIIVATTFLCLGVVNLFY